jgi:hypothetical protein
MPIRHGNGSPVGTLLITVRGIKINQMKTAGVDSIPVTGTNGTISRVTENIASSAKELVKFVKIIFKL